MNLQAKTFIYSIITLLFFSITTSEICAQWEELSGDNPPPRKQHTMININNTFYVFGGKDDIGDFADTWAFIEDEWVNQYPTFSPGARHGHTAVSIDDKMYLFGGSGNGFLLNDLWEYDPATNTWKLITTTGTMPSPRNGHTAIYYAGTNSIYIMGGTTSDGGSSELFALDLSTNQWTQKADMLNFDVTNHGAGILNDILIIFGGNSFFAPFSDHFFTYDLATDTWNSIDDIGGDDFFGRSDFSFTQTDDAIHVMGGTNDDLVFEDPFGDHLMIEMDEGSGIIMIDHSIDIPIFADGFESGNASAWTNDGNKIAAGAPVQILMFGGASNGALLDKTWYYTNCVTVRDSLDMTICDGESYEGYEAEGIYEDTFEAVNGCDSVRTLNLTVLPNVNSTLSMELCFGEMYEGYTESGTFEDLFMAENGCDSIRILELTIGDRIVDSVAMSICYGETYEGYSESGWFEDAFEASNGCDSTRVLELDIEPQIEDTIMTIICPGGTFEGYTEEGWFSDIFEADNGCDSTRWLEIMIQPEVYLTDTIIMSDSGTGNGSIEIIVDGEIEDYIIEWSNGEDTSNIVDLEAGDYGVTLTDTIGCSTEFEITVPFITSTQNEMFRMDFDVFPNPVFGSNSFQLSSNVDISGIYSVKLLDIEGKVVMNWADSNEELKHNEFYLNNVAIGIYIIQVFMNDGVISRKLFVQ